MTLAHFVASGAYNTNTTNAAANTTAITNTTAIAIANTIAIAIANTD